MGTRTTTGLVRRTFLRGCLAAPATLALATLGGGGYGIGPRPSAARVAHAQTVPLTPACADAAETVDNAEGPYYRLYTPEKRSFRADTDGGVLLTLSGTITDPACRPVEGAIIDFWHANQNGEYDLSGYKLRGHQRTGADGTYLLETIVPKWYWDGSLQRTSHIHVKLQAPAGPLLTTQLFFPDNLQAYGQDTGALNAQDFLVPPEGIATVTIQLGPLVANHYAGRFDFVVATAYPPLTPPTGA